MFAMGPAFFNRKLSASPTPGTVRGTFAQWNMEETSGTTAADSSGNGYNATYSGGYTLGQASILPSGFGKSVLLDHASGGYVAIPTGFIASNLKPPFSMLAFIKPVDVSRSQQIMASTTGGVNWYIYSDGTMYIGSAGVANYGSDTRALTSGMAVLVSVTVSATGVINFYINKTVGTASAAGAFSGSTTGTDNARIGDWDASGTAYQYSFDGNMQRLIMSNVELSGMEIGTYYDTL